MRARRLLAPDPAPRTARERLLDDVPASRRPGRRWRGGTRLTVPGYGTADRNPGPRTWCAACTASGRRGGVRLP